MGTLPIDLNVAKLLGLGPSCIIIPPFGHGTSSASAARISAKLPGGIEQLFFMKTSDADDATLLVEGIHHSLTTACLFQACH